MYSKLNLAKVVLLVVINLAILGIKSSTATQSDKFTDENEKDTDFLYSTFPNSFQWGLGTSSYQVEGGWNADGKGLNIWDKFTHKTPSPIFDQTNGDVACNSYENYSEDVKILKAMGVDFYRFSLSWARLLPNGSIDVINPAGINYYNNLIDELIQNGIEPMVTLYHWDLPDSLMKIGGWPNEKLVQNFADYARLAFASFGDRVKTWLTFNEAWVICYNGYGDGIHAPGFKKPGTLPYQCAHNLLKSHALAYRIYEREFKRDQKGRVGISLSSRWAEPETHSAEDVAAAERVLQFEHGWFASPIFFGKYPDVMRKYIDAKSKAEGRSVSRLPEFDAGWSFLLKGSWDFLGLNHYSTNMVKTGSPGPPGWADDQETVTYFDPSWETSASSWLKVVPWGFRKILNWIKITYGNPLVIVTENGFSDKEDGGLNDTRRIHYYKEYINNLLKAVVKDGCNVGGYSAWSLMDNFEWGQGYTERFGIHWVNFDDPKRSRIPKESAKFLAKVFAQNGFPTESDNKAEEIPTTSRRLQNELR